MVIRIKRYFSLGLIVCLAFAISSVFSSYSAFAAASNALEPTKRVYDDADLFTDAEERELNALLGSRSAELNAHFVILTTNEDTELQGYTDNFYAANIKGKGGVSDCVSLTVNMTTRRVAIDCYGELRTMISDYEMDPIREAFTSDLTSGEYVRVANAFLADMSALAKQKYAEYNIDTPTVDPSLRLYDFANALSASEYGALSSQLKDISDKDGIDYIIVIVDDDVNSDYLRRFSSSFYKQNFKGDSEYAGAYMLALAYSETPYMSQINVNTAVAAAPFGEYDPTNSVIWDDEDAVQYKLSETESVLVAVELFISRKLDAWQSTHIEIPTQFDPSDYVIDYAGVLTPADKDWLAGFAGEQAERQKTHFYIVTVPYSSSVAVSNFSFEFWSAHYLQFPENYILLCVGTLPTVEGEEPQVDLSYGGKPYAKIGYEAYGETISAVRGILKDSGDYKAAGEAYINITSKAVSSWIPKIAMVEDLPEIVQFSLLAAIVAALILIIVLLVGHNLGLKRKPSAISYLDRDSFVLSYSSDRFVSTYTSRTKIEHESSSGGGGGGSSGGGHSSHSEGSF